MSRALETMRQGHRCAMLTTSFFISVPMSESINTDPVFGIILLMTLLASLLHWSRYKFNSIWHWMDRMCVLHVFAYLFCFYFNMRNVVLCVVAIILFLCGRWSTRERHKLGFHLLFRFVSFWTCMSVTSTLSAGKMVITTLAYLIVIQLSLAYTSA